MKILNPNLENVLQWRNHYLIKVNRTKHIMEQYWILKSIIRVNPCCGRCHKLYSPSYHLYVVWMGEESMEIKKQITGMMRLLGDKTGRVYQRLGVEQNRSTKEPQDSQLNCMHTPPILPVVSEDNQYQNWSSPGDPELPPSSESTSIPNGQACSQYSTHSRVLRTVSTTKDLIKPNETKGLVSGDF